ncbi:glutamate racemase [Phocicoccus pinnipedialis]|uniref:Glutamate racemase n=1 Tax=Phocicoccus pinnipedialis TaxID=110845 RepID=A0A6V7RC63_9BACL|nr:glutamate racemase [Jeotgalicoccus pinnipedialis]MBP1939462.1 glutamate racemase [Jeotgalicoccus pinnipedialis]CAD2075312.1 Glutamate racemase [Jeotgalicoccus pinnipedialis]
MNKAIGVMDSGVGGLTVIKELMRQLPNEKIIYFADERRCPYGDKSQNQVREFTEEIACFLSAFDIKLLVLACNTATAASMPELREKLDIPVMGVIQPGSRSAIQRTNNQKVIVLSTKGTTESHAYGRKITRINRDVEVTEFACAPFVPLVESGRYHDEDEVDKCVNEVLATLKEHEADTVILGCTHYPLISHSISKFFDYNKHIVDSGYETAREVSTFLDFHDMLNTEKPEKHKFYINGDYHRFEETLNKWIPNMRYTIESVDL